MRATVVSGDVAGAANKTLLAIFATAARRPKLLQIIIGCTAAPADATARFALRRITADGTGTALSNTFAMDPGDGAPVVTAKGNYTAEPTYATGNILEIGLNQRATVIWNAPDDESRPSCAVGAANGLGLQMVAGPTVNYNITFTWDE